VLLERVVQASTGEATAEASYRIARILSAQGQHAAAAEWYFTAAYVAAGSKWERPGMLGAAQALTALNLPNEARIASEKAAAQPAIATPRATTDEPAASPPLTDQRPNGDGYASLRFAEALERAGNHESALDQYLAAAHQTRGTPAASRALLGAIRSLIELGDRPAAEALYRRLLESSDADPAVLTDARRTIRGASR
jgi:tetratricopeptide (TPR) repeat protein